MSRKKSNRRTVSSQPAKSPGPVKIAAHNVDLLMSDAPNRLRRVATRLLIGDSRKQILDNPDLAILPGALDRLAALVGVDLSWDNPHFLTSAENVCRRLSGLKIALTAADRDERAVNIAAMVSAGVSVADVALRFGLSDVAVRNVCRKKGVKLYVGRPRMVR